MTARASTLGPVVVAESAAEAVRTLNHLTLVHPSAGAPGWEDVTDLYRVLTEVMVLVDRLPQVFDQIARHLRFEVDRGGCRTDSGTDQVPMNLVARAVDGLSRAQEHGRALGEHLAVAQSAVSHFAPVPDDVCGLPASSQGVRMGAGADGSRADER